MTYLERLQPKITLTSPSGLVFNAKWVGNPRTLEKELGIFKTPGIRGVISQDLDVRGVLYPLRFFFDGPDNDKEADRFVTACAENGPWIVIHPVSGSKTLQLVSVTEDIQPVTSGNVTGMTTDWIEVLEGQGAKSAAQLSAETISQNITLCQEASTQLDSVVTLDTADKVGRFRNSIENVVTVFDNTLQDITETVAEVQAQADSIKSGIDATLAGTPIDLLSIAGQIQALIGLPNLVVTDLSSKIDTYVRFSELIFGFSPESTSPAGINIAAAQELAQTATIGAVAVASVTTALSSRQSVIDNIEANLSLFTSITNGLDATQEIYVDELLSKAYFSQSQTYHDAARTVGLTIAFLIKTVFDLSVEKKITLEEAGNPVMIAMREYGGPGELDKNIDLFYDSNSLTGEETYLLKAGKEVLIYL